MYLESSVFNVKLGAGDYRQNLILDAGRFKVFRTV